MGWNDAETDVVKANDKSRARYVLSDIECPNPDCQEPLLLKHSGKHVCRKRRGRLRDECPECGRGIVVRLKPVYVARLAEEDDSE